MNIQLYKNTSHQNTALTHHLSPLKKENQPTKTHLSLTLFKLNFSAKYGNIHDLRLRKVRLKVTWDINGIMN